MCGNQCNVGTQEMRENKLVCPPVDSNGFRRETVIFWKFIISVNIIGD
jgi:hypothetical protein